MRFAAVRGRWSPAVAAAFLVAASACSPQCGVAAKPNPTSTPLAATSSATSPSTSPAAPLQIAAATFHPGAVGAAYQAVGQAAAGGVEPYTWSVASGALPDGVTLGPDGSVSGSPTSAGNFSFTVQVSDSRGGSASLPGSISVAPQLSAGLIPACAQYCRVELGCTNACGAFGQQKGGQGPYAYDVVQGQLPAGTSLNGLWLAGSFKGLAGWLQFTGQISDAVGGTATVDRKFWMYDHIALAGGTCGPSRSSCRVTLAYTGGTPAQNVAAVPTSWSGANCGFTAPFPCPEPNIAVTYQPGAITMNLTYQPNYPATFGTMTIQLTSTDLCGSGVQCTASATVNVQG